MARWRIFYSATPSWEMLDVCLDGTQSISAMYPLRQTLTSESQLVDVFVPSMRDELLKMVLQAEYHKLFKELAQMSKEVLMAVGRDGAPANGFHRLDLTEKLPKLDFVAHVVKRNFVEIRSPLLEYPVVEAIQRIPADLRTQRYIYYKAFRRLSPALAQIRLMGTGVPVDWPYRYQLLGRSYKGFQRRLYRGLRRWFGFPRTLDGTYDWGVDYNGWYRTSEAVGGFADRCLKPEAYLSL